MKNHILFAVAFTLFSLFGRCQIDNLVINRIAHLPVSELQVSITPPEFSKFVDSTFSYRNGCFLKTSRDLFFWLTGSGRLYRLHQIDSLKFYATRVDSTDLLGYNVDAFPFVYNDSIYNFGGYGFWRNNGQLRVFLEKNNEWGIIPLNKEIPFLFNRNEGAVWLDAKSGKLYLLFSVERNQSLSDGGQITNMAYELDLKSRNWNTLGNISDFLNDRYYSIRSVASLKEGLLVSMNNQYHILSFKENRIYTLKKEYKSFLQLINNWKTAIYFQHNELLFNGDLISNRLDSFQLSLDDFENTGIPIYVKMTYSKFILLFLMPFCLIALLIWHYFRRRNPTSKPFSKLNLAIDNSERHLLNKKELEVLSLIFTNTIDSRKTQIEELNSILGLQFKNNDVQKKHRSDIILSTNQKLCSIFSSKKQAINKERASNDKRTFEYFINPELIENVSSYLSNFK